MPGAHMTYERRSMYSYRISGLHVSSQFELPGAIPEASQTELADVTIRRTIVPSTLEGADPATLEGADPATLEGADPPHWRVLTHRVQPGRWRAKNSSYAFHAWRAS